MGAEACKGLQYYSNMSYMYTYRDKNIQKIGIWKIGRGLRGLYSIFKDHSPIMKKIFLKNKREQYTILKLFFSN